MKLRRPSPALVISVIALIVACAGTAVAATIVTSSSQIKNGVVQSADIKDGSIQARDLRNGTITESKLAAGVVKKLGGAAAAPTDSISYEGRRATGPEGQPANVVVTVASLQVPAGAYLVTAKAVMSAIVPPQDILNGLVQSPGSAGGRCKLNAAGDGDEALQNVVINGRQTPATLNMEMTRTVGAPSEFTLECSAGVPFRLSETSIIATKMGTVQRSDATPATPTAAVAR